MSWSSDEDEVIYVPVHTISSSSGQSRRPLVPAPPQSAMPAPPQPAMAAPPQPVMPPQPPAGAANTTHGQFQHRPFQTRPTLGPVRYGRVPGDERARPKVRSLPSSPPARYRAAPGESPRPRPRRKRERLPSQTNARLQAEMRRRFPGRHGPVGPVDWPTQQQRATPFTISQFNPQVGRPDSQWRRLHPDRSR